LGLQGIRIIAFFGADGVGKSTQVQLLIKRLQQLGQKCRKAWIRSPHGFAFYAWRLLIRIGYKRVLTNRFGYRLELPIVDRDPLMKRIWPWFELINIIPIFLAKVKIPLMLGYTIIAERLLVDSIATIAHFIYDTRFPQSTVARLLLSLTPQDTLFIHLTCDYKTLMARRRNLVEPYDSSIFQMRIFDELANHLNALTINTAHTTPQQTHEMIWSYLQPIMGRCNAPQ